MLFIISFANLSVFSLVWAQETINPYKSVLNTTLKSGSLESVEFWDVVTGEKWADLFNDQILVLVKYVIYAFIVVWIAVAFFWGYKIMTSNKEEDMKEWLRLVIFGVLWIIIMVSAEFLATSLVWNDGLIRTEFAGLGDDDPNWVQVAELLYNKVMFPFIKIALYLVVWALFFMMAAKVVSYVVSTDDTAKKKAWWTIIWCVVWILIVMMSKQVVEAVMWKQQTVLNKEATMFAWWDLWIWEEIMDFGSIPLIAQIINWAMWLTMFVLLVLIVIQWYKMFTKPDDPKNRESLKKTLLYILIWVLVIGAAYVISNALVVDKLNII